MIRHVRVEYGTVDYGQVRLRTVTNRTLPLIYTIPYRTVFTVPLIYTVQYGILDSQQNLTKFLIPDKTQWLDNLELSIMRDLNLFTEKPKI